MNAKKYMILVKGEPKTSEIRFCKYNADTKKWDVEYNNGQKFPYAYQNIEWIKEPIVLNPNMYQIGRDGCTFHDINAVYVFRGKTSEWWHICFENGSERDYLQNELSIAESCLKNKQAENIFEYMKQIAKLSDLKSETTGERILAKKFEEMDFVGPDVALAKYLNPQLLKKGIRTQEYIPIFPFGCNNSQYKAVKSAMENQISVIQGPPGTGKTQTILNIIANILMEGKTVQIVSNNNSATENVLEKLSSPKYNLGFIVAPLGKSKNKKKFIASQSENYPNFSSWRVEHEQKITLQEIRQKSQKLKEIFDKQEELAVLKQEYSQLVIEIEYFQEYLSETDVDTDRIKINRNLTAKDWMLLWQESQMNSEEKSNVGLWFKMKCFFLYGIKNFDFYKQDISKIITTYQAMYYQANKTELANKIADIEAWIKETESGLLDDLCNQSMMLLKDKLAKKYADKVKRPIFTEEQLWKNSKEILNEYPVILSTTFSSRSSLKSDVIYDYLIMDEASQVDVATGALALSCARNVIIVGDTKQLPNVITDDVRKQSEAIFESFHINDGYRFTNSFLQSVLDIMPNVAQTLLREHYRCHPKIINFCNQKFYKGELIIMTKDNGEEDVLRVVKTVPGNHMRNHYSQRQIDVIKNEIIPNYVTNMEETGIIAPYKNQVEALEKEFQNIDAATVHKFQGKEKDTIIISTVDDEITDFADDPYLINVAVSRAKKKLMLVVTGNEQTKERNITDLIEYIQYNNFEVVESKVYSIFDYLYKQYTKERKLYLQKRKKVSQYDSENLMNALIEDILSTQEFSFLDVVEHFPLNMLIKEPKLLEEKECRYAMNPGTHVDFLIYNRISKKPILAVEVDGYEYHNQETEQAARDVMKDHILELYEIPLMRFWTNGSGEKERITGKLREILS